MIALGRAFAVVSSSRATCEVCAGEGMVAARLAVEGAWSLVPCPHHTNPQLPIVHLPVRQDIPRGGAA